MKNIHLSLHRPSTSTIILGLKITFIVVAALVVFYQDLVMVANDALNSEFMSHILAIPFLFGYLLYRKRKMIRASIPFEPSPSHGNTFLYKEILGTLLFLIAFLTYSYGSYTFTPLEFHMFALPIFVTACTLIMFNTQTLRQLAFPILFLFFLIPPPTQIVYALGSTLSTISTQASCTILNLFGFAAKISTVYGNPEIIITQPDGTQLPFTVDIACSGIYSLIGFLIFATFIAYIARTKRTHAWKKPAIFLIGLPLIYVLNILRITIIVSLGYYYGMELAMNVFHLLGGWALIFLGTLLLLIVTEKALKVQLFTKKETVSCPECNPIIEHEKNFCSACGKTLKYVDVKPSKLDLTKITALVIAVVLILSIQTPIFALTKGPVDILTQLAEGKQPTIEILPQINDYTLIFIYRDREFEQQAKQDASLIYAYIPTDKSEDIIWVALEIASTRSSLHNWEACLIEAPLKLGEQAVTHLDLRNIELLENPPLIARYFAFQYEDNNLTQVVLYWYETSTFTTNTTTQHKHVKISLIVYSDETESIQQTEDKLLIFGTAIANYWQPIKTWTEIALLISKNGNYLLLTPTILLIITILFQAFSHIKTKQENLKAYQKLPEKDKKILQAIQKTNKNHKGTTQEIASAYKKLNEEQIKLDTLHETLSNLEEAGLTKQTITNENDEPILKWKTNISLPKHTLA